MPDLGEIFSTRCLVLLGCGKMGAALLEGWLAQGLSAKSVAVFEPNPSAWLCALEVQGMGLNQRPGSSPLICLLAVKPQIMWQALPQIKAFSGGDTCFLSIAAGITLGLLEERLGSQTPIIRAMPNTPSTIGKGITALIGNGAAKADDIALAQGLLSTVGQTVVLEREADMDAVTAVSGSGPAYIFHLIEAMIGAAIEQGLSPELAEKLVLATVSGAGELALSADESATKLRENVTSPGGTTAAALIHLMDEKSGFSPLLSLAVEAAAVRSRELAKT